MTEAVIRFAAADRTSIVTPGNYLRSFDPNANNGRGSATWTSDPEQALRFPTRGDAALFWKTQSTVRPRRPDGKPNRPLTAYSVSVEDAP